MFERDIISQLAAWKTDTNRKPLVVHGARQVGKTWTLKYFGREYFDDVAYFSLDKDAMSSEQRKTLNELFNTYLFCMERR